MSKVLHMVKQSFTLHTRGTNYLYEFFVWISTLIILAVLVLLSQYIRYKYDNVISIIIFILFVWQTVTLFFRLLQVKENKIEMQIRNNEYLFFYEPVLIDYKKFKSVLRNSLGSFNLYCKSDKGKNHIIGVRVYHYKRKNMIEKVYFFDNDECDFNKLLMSINEKGLIVDKNVIVLGNNMSKKMNPDFVYYLLKEYG